MSKTKIEIAREYISLLKPNTTPTTDGWLIDLYYGLCKRSTFIDRLPHGLGRSVVINPKNSKTGTSVVFEFAEASDHYPPVPPMVVPKPHGALGQPMINTSISQHVS